MKNIVNNPTLYPNALTSAERDPTFKWHGHADSPRSSQIFCLSAFGTLRNFSAGNQVLASLFYEAFPDIATKQRPRKWTISPECEDEDLLNEKGTLQPTSVDVLCVSSQEVICIESKFVTDAAEEFGVCNQAGRGDCAGYYGPGSDKKMETGAWCRLEAWEGKRSPRLYWSSGKPYFKSEVFDPQSSGQTCPFSGPLCQLMRNFLFTAAMSEHDRKRFFGVLAICPEVYSEILGSQVEGFCQSILRPAFRDRVKFLTYETLIGHLRSNANPEAKALADFLEERIDTICRKQRA